METYKLTKVFTTNKDKNGNELKSKDGRPYTRMSIKTAQYGDKWLSGFQNKVNANWKEGDEVQMIVKQNGEYLNFETPKKDDELNEKLEKILNGITGINLRLASLLDDKQRGYHYPTPEEEGIDVSDTNY